MAQCKAPKTIALNQRFASLPLPPTRLFSSSTLFTNETSPRSTRTTMESLVILVSDVAQLETFIAGLEQQTTTVHSLAIAVDPDALPERHGYSDDITASQSTQHFWQLMEELSCTLPKLDCLHTFSLQVLNGRNGFWIPRPLIATLLLSLPASCASVEIDTLGCDYTEPGPVHLCDTISNILPNLKHVRLNLSNICAKALRVNTQRPKLTTLTISCFAQGYYDTRLCGSYIEDPVHSCFGRGEEAMPHLVNQMKALAEQCPLLTHALICDQSRPDSYNEAFHQSYNRRDVLKDTVTAMPLVRIYPFVDDGNMLRAPDADVFGSFAALKRVLEAEVSEQHGSDRRLPQDMEELRLLGLNEWKVKYPGRSCQLWANEKRAGARLIEACVVDGAASRISMVEDSTSSQL